MTASDWRRLPLSLAELCIDTTLRCGQSFRWRKIGDEWHCALHGRVVSLRQDPTHLHYRVTWPEQPAASSAARRPTLSAGSPALTPPPSVRRDAAAAEEAGNGDTTKGDAAAAADADDDGTEALLLSYFNLSHDLPALYARWAAADANFRRRAPAFAGVRILNQDAWEALVCFVCSSNNNIARISLMVRRLCEHYGAPLGRVAGEVFHDFPSPAALLAHGGSHAVEARLRDLGFGYRARYIAETARLVARERPADWLLRLRNPACPAWSSVAPSRGLVVAKAGPSLSSSSSLSEEEEEEEGGDAKASYRSAHDQLLQLTGVGPKVADCVCLMGLGWGEAVPVDTHVWQIAVRDYKFGSRKGGSGGSGKTFSKAMYDAVGDHFRALWGPQAGWAHSVLFTADLRAFSDRGIAGKDGKKKAAESAGVVKVEEEEEETKVSGADTVAKKRRRTVVADIKVEDDEGGDAKTVELSGTRRTSKRLRTKA